MGGRFAVNQTAPDPRPQRTRRNVTARRLGDRGRLSRRAPTISSRNRSSSRSWRRRSSGNVKAACPQRGTRLHNARPLSVDYHSYSAIRSRGCRRLRRRSTASEVGPGSRRDRPFSLQLRLVLQRSKKSMDGETRQRPRDDRQAMREP